MKIANKIRFSFLIVGLIPAGAAVSIYVVARNNLSESIRNNLSTAISARTDHVETYLKMLETSVGQLSKSTVLENLLKIGDKKNPRRNEAFDQAMKELKRTKEANPAIAEFLLMYKNGTVAASSNESSVGSNRSTDALFLGARKGNCIKDVYYSEIFKEPLLAVSAPLVDSRTGEFAGVLAARVKLAELNSIVAGKTGMGRTGEFYLVNRYGYMITPSRFGEDAVLKQRVDTENTRRALLHKGREQVVSHERIGDFPDYRGVRVLGAHEYLPRMQWTMLAEIEAKEAFAPLAELRLMFLMVVFMTLLLAMALGRGITGAIVGPLHSLQKGTEVIGGGNLDYRVGTDAGDEVGQLSRAFDQMTQRLKKTTASIDSLNKEISARTRAENVLRIKDAAITSSISGIVITDLDGNLNYVNDSFLRLWGYDDAREVIGKSVFMFWDDPAPAQVAAEAIRQSGRWSGELNGKKKDGSIITVQLAGNIIVDSDSHAVGMMASSFDITARKRAEEALEEAQHSFKIIFDSVNDGILIADLETRKFYTANNAICKMLGYSLEEIRNLGVMDIHPNEDLPWILETFERQAKGDLTISSDMPVKRKDNSIFYVAVNANLLTTYNKRYVIGVFRDITERKEMEKRLMTAERLAAVGAFVAGASHELNNPLACVIGFSQLALDNLRRGKPGHEELKGILEKVMSNADRCRAIVGSLLASGRGYSVQLAPVNVHEVIDEAIELAGRQASFERIELKKDYSPDVPLVFANRVALSKVFVNVALNACQAMEGRGTLKVTTEREGNGGRVIFKDSGVGIKKENLHKVFEPFFSTKEVGEGVGLGLSVCAGIIKSHCGDITVQSDGEGRGTTVTIMIPIEKKGGHEKKTG